ncbi:phosphotransferase enzyme family protein [Kitasatospora sp. NPDC051853]|uniref:phosphotransferase enzyme family protein n=1 Tax=Kitasatospora sp. NPDC051853 TaxID=3364058 RepID=UPI0037BE0CE9
MAAHLPTAPATRTAEATATAGIPTAVREALESASASQGYNTDGATLLHHNQHWVLRLPHATPGSPVVAKVHNAKTDRLTLTRQVATANWLTDNGVGTARPAGTRWPILAGHHLVTFTYDLGPGGPASPQALGRALAQLHALPLPGHLNLPRLDPAANVLARIEQLPDNLLAPEEHAWLTGYVRTLGDRFDATRWPGEPVVLHGDLAAQNTISTGNGAVLIDWEYAGTGPALADLAFLAWSRDAFGGNPRHYDQFSTTYGLDVTAVHGGTLYRQVLAPLRAVIGITIALEAATRAPGWADEAAHRIACTRAQEAGHPRYPWAWSTCIAYTRPAELSPT